MSITITTIEEPAMPWAVNALLEVGCNYRVNNQHCMNVLHYNPSGDSTGFSIAELVDAFADTYGGIGNGTFSFEFAQCLGENVTYFETTFQAVFPERWAKQVREVAVVGARAGQVTAQNVAATISKAGQLAGRNRVGSLHLGGVSPNEYSGGLLTAPYKLVLNLLIDFLDDVLTPAATPTVTYHPVIANKTQVPGSDPPKFVYSGSTGIVNWDIQDTLRTSRRRNVGVGI